MPANPNWTRDVAIAAFNGEGPHAEILKMLEAHGRRDLFLNVGYSKWGQRHWSGKAQVRLIDRLATGINRETRKSGLEPTILDVGAGRGGAALRLHERWKFDVTGIDPSDRNLEMSRRKVRDLEIHQGVLFKKGRMEHLPFSDAGFSHAMAVESFAYVQDKATSMSEIRRVLRPGGCFALAALLVDAEVVTSSELNRAIYRDFLTAWDFHDLNTREGYEALLESAGFEIRKTEFPTDRTLVPHQRRLGRMLRLWQAAPLYRMSRSWIKRKTGADLNLIRPQLDASNQAIDAGVVEYGLFWAIAP